MTENWDDPERLRGLSSAEWEQVKTAIAAANPEIDGTVVVHAHVWPSAVVDGPADWMLFVLGTAYAVRGTSRSVDAIFNDMSAQLALWYPSAMR